MAPALPVAPALPGTCSSLHGFRFPRLFGLTIRVSTFRTQHQPPASAPPASMCVPKIPPEKIPRLRVSPKFLGRTQFLRSKPNPLPPVSKGQPFDLLTNSIQYPAKPLKSEFNTLSKLSHDFSTAASPERSPDRSIDTVANRSH